MRTGSSLSSLHERIPDINITPVSTSTSILSNIGIRNNNNLNNNSSNNQNNNNNSNGISNSGSSNHHNSNNNNNNLLNNNNNNSIDIKTEGRSPNLVIDERNGTR